MISPFLIPPLTGGTPFLGSYYVLEVGNFDKTSRVHVTPPREDLSSTGQVSVVRDDESLQPGYYMLDIHNFNKSEQSKNTAREDGSQGTLSRPGQYENVPTTSNDLRSYDSPRNVAMHVNKHPAPSQPSEPMTGRVSPLAASTQAGSVEPNTRVEGVQSPPGQKAEPAYGNVNRGSVPPAYENIFVQSGEESESPPPLPQKKRTKTPSETSVGKSSVTDEEKRSSLRRRDVVYEAISVGGGASRVKQKTPSQSFSPTGSEQVHDSNADSKGLSRLSDDENSVSKELNSSEVMTLKRISTSNDPFAGLVMSASTQMEESLQASNEHVLENDQSDLSNGVYRGRTETVWDNDRVEKEWTQVCVGVSVIEWV